MTTEGSAQVTLSILLPVRNEGPNLSVLLRLLPAAMDVPHEVLVIYDRPDDDDLPVVEAFKPRYPNLRAVRNDQGVGMPNALRTGIANARGDYVLIFAADDIGPFVAIEDMLGLMDRGCEYIACTRYAHGGRRIGGHLIGSILSRTANLLTWRVGGSVFSDTTSGRVMFRREVFDRLHLDSPPVGWVILFEMSLKAELAGLRLGEVPIISIDRLYGGTSTFVLGSWLVEYLKRFMWGARELRRPGRVRQEPMRPARHVATP